MIMLVLLLGFFVAFNVVLMIFLLKAPPLNLTDSNLEKVIREWREEEFE